METRQTLKDNYLNAEGFDAGALASQVLTTGIEMLFAVKDAKNQRKLEETIAKMSLETQKEIADKLALAQTDIERQRIAFQILALDKNNALLDGLERDKYKSMIIVGIGAVALATVIFLAKKRKK